MHTEHPIPRVLVLFFLLMITVGLTVESIPQPRDTSHMYIENDGTYRYMGYTVTVKGDTIVTSEDKSPISINKAQGTITTECLNVTRDDHNHIDVWVSHTVEHL